MIKHYLKAFFEPTSIAVIGASTRPDSVGHIIFRNLIDSKFEGKLYPVNPKYTNIEGYKAHSDITSINQPIDLVIIATPAMTVPDIIETCGKNHIKAAIVISAGFSESDDTAQILERKILNSVRAYSIRVLGPNCLGILRPSNGLNATFYKGTANPGTIAFVSQSGALCSAILDWAKTSNVGFSNIISLGSTLDIDFGEILDYLITDTQTKCVLLYIEGIRNARNFISAIRAAARIKPVLLIKTGRHSAVSQAAYSHTAALIGSDDVFDAAISRVGAVRVQSISQLFSVSKALACGFHPSGNRLAIVTNGGGPGVMAADYALELGLELARLSTVTLDKLNLALPKTWSHNNPIDLIGDAQADRYQLAIDASLSDCNVDGILVILTPQAMTQPLAVAKAVVTLSQQHKKPIMTCWMGGAQVDESRVLFEEQNLPSFRTPEPALEVFSFHAAYSKHQQLLLQVPAALSNQEPPDLNCARTVIEYVLENKRNSLTEMEAKVLLSAFRIPVSKTLVAHSLDEALLIAEELGFPVVLKINSSEIVHKTDVSGVILDIANSHEFVSAYHNLIDRVSANCPNMMIDGVTVQPMLKKPNGRELMIGVVWDKVFGPVISFGMGGTLVEIIQDRSIALPPLNSLLIKNLINGSKAIKMLGDFRNQPPVNLTALENILLRVSEMVCELPMLTEMDINPLIIDEDEAIAVDARIRVDSKLYQPNRYAHMAIQPYPMQLTSHWQLNDGTEITIRPIRPEDATIEKNFVKNLSESTRFFRFMSTLKNLSPSQLAVFTQIDYDRELALIAVINKTEQEEEIGVARYIKLNDKITCEFAIVVADDFQGKGLGRKLMHELISAARSNGLVRMQGQVLVSNSVMLKFLKTLEFQFETDSRCNDTYLASKFI